MSTTDTFTVVTTMKNEGAFLLEWVAHHKALGFDHLVICTNDCEDTTAEMVQRLQKLGLVRGHETRYRPGQSIQRRALRQAMTHDEVRTSDWLYICDADEFLASRIGDGSVRALIAAGSPDVEAISLPWRRFGANGRECYEEGPVTRQFLRGDATCGPRHIPFSLAKTIFRTDLLPFLERPGVHVPLPRADLGRDIRRELPGGVAVRAEPSKLHVQADYRLAQINHYQLRALESFLVKVARGRVNHVHDSMGLVYWLYNNRNDEPCDLIRRYDAEVEIWMELLLADRRLNTLHHRAVRWHRSKIADLLADPGYADLIASLRAAPTGATQAGAATSEAA